MLAICTTVTQIVGSTASDPIPDVTRMCYQMAMNWLRPLIDRFKRPKGLYPECLWNVSANESGFRVTDQTGETVFVHREDLASVVIATNDTGPWGADIWWLLSDADGQLVCGYPQGATGEKDVLDALLALPGFDKNEMVKAMGCTSNATFIVWQR